MSIKNSHRVIAVTSVKVIIFKKNTIAGSIKVIAENNKKKSTVVTFVKAIMLGIYFGISFRMILFSNTYFKKTHILLFVNS